MIRAIRRLFSPPSPAPRPRPATGSRPPQAAASAPAITPVRHYFEALNVVDHRTPIPATGLYVHRLLSKFNRLQLASVARYLWDNVGLVFYATDLVANYSTPMVPRAATLDRKWNEAANSLFDDWAERADFTGRFDFWDLQRLSSFYLDTDGEVFALWTDEAGFPQIQFLESFRIDKPTVQDDQILDGVQLDAKGRVLGYWLDGQSLLSANVLVHLFDLERFDAQHESDHPLALLFPGSLPSPLSVDVFEATYDPATDTTLISGQMFSGRVLSVSLRGKRVTARCSSFPDAFGSQVPGYFFQPHCNYRVYEPNTCRVSQSSFEVACAVTGIDGREITVSGAALAGLPAQWFALGWIQTGVGTAFESRGILASTAEVGGSLTLSLASEFRNAEVSQAAVVVPGCDGTDFTCLNKFSNFDNFGGQRFAFRNLTVKALEIPASDSGKK